MSADTPTPDPSNTGGGSYSVRSGQPLVGTLAVPGDKSISHRSLLLAALAEGTSTISVVALGADVEDDGPTVVVRGGRSRLHAPDGPIDLGNSGTGMRLLAGVAATLSGTTTLTGDLSLRSRPSWIWCLHRTSWTCRSQLSISPR